MCSPAQALPLDMQAWEEGLQWLTQLFAVPLPIQVLLHMPASLVSCLILACSRLQILDAYVYEIYMCICTQSTHAKCFRLC